MLIKAFIRHTFIPFLLLFGVTSHALAGIEIYSFSDDKLQARFEQLSKELRCPKCQNQNLAGSDSLIATDLRKLIQQQLEQGKSDAEIKSYLVSRYGDFILYRPPLKPSTWLLWILPWVALLIGVAIVYALRRGNDREETKSIDKNQLQKLINNRSHRDH